MVPIPTFLLYCSCAVSVMSLLVSLSSLRRASVVPDIPKRVAADSAAAVTAVKLLDQRLDSHVKSDAGKAGAASRKANSDGGNGGSAFSVSNMDAALAQSTDRRF